MESEVCNTSQTNDQKILDYLDPKQDILYHKHKQYARKLWHFEICRLLYHKRGPAGLSLWLILRGKAVSASQRFVTCDLSRLSCAQLRDVPAKSSPRCDCDYENWIFSFFYLFVFWLFIRSYLSSIPHESLNKDTLIMSSRRKSVTFSLGGKLWTVKVNTGPVNTTCHFGCLDMSHDSFL